MRICPPIKHQHGKMEKPMRCPVDNETLVMADRNGVEIDYCPKCRGVWLDRGELDKIIDRAAGTSEPVARPAPREAGQSGQQARTAACRAPNLPRRTTAPP